MQYFVVMIDYGRRGREAIVDPEITRRDVISRVASGEYSNISFIHEIADCSVDDITAEILAEAAVPEIPIDRMPIRRPVVSITPAISGSTNRCDRAEASGPQKQIRTASLCEIGCYHKATCTEDCAAVPFTFARVDEGHRSNAVSWLGVEIHRASAKESRHASLYPASPS